MLRDLRALLEALPAGALVATLPRGIKGPKPRAANPVLRGLAGERGLPVADLWVATGPPYRGKCADGLHPNAGGLTDWVAAIGAALGQPPEVDPPRVRPRGRRRLAG